MWWKTERPLEGTETPPCFLFPAQEGDKDKGDKAPGHLVCNGHHPDNGTGG